MLASWAIPKHTRKSSGIFDNSLWVLIKCVWSALIAESDSYEDTVHILTPVANKDEHLLDSHFSKNIFLWRWKHFCEATSVLVLVWPAHDGARLDWAEGWPDSAPLYWCWGAEVAPPTTTNTTRSQGWVRRWRGRQETNLLFKVHISMIFLFSLIIFFTFEMIP